MNPKRITVQAGIDTVTGYGQHAIALITRLEAAGYWVDVRPIKVYEPNGFTIPAKIRSRFVHCPQPDDYEIILAPPQGFNITPGKKFVLWTMWETSLPTLDWVAKMNKASLILLPSAWNKASFHEKGGSVKTHVIPLGLDSEDVCFTEMNMAGPCVFGAAGRIQHGASRKGISEVIKTFKTAFYRSMDVKLMVKVSSDDPMDHESDPRIHIIRESWPRWRIRKFLSSITCFVSAAKGEGWGLWQHHAMASGRPVIASIYGGLSEFMAPHNSYPVNYTVTPVEKPYPGGGDWAAPSQESLVEQMRRVYVDREEARERGKLAMDSVKHMTWDYSIGRAIEVMKMEGIL